MKNARWYWIALATIMILSSMPVMGACCPMKAACPKEWKVGVQCWTFQKFTYVEAVQKAAAAGADYIEIFPGQLFSQDTGELRVHHTMTAQQRQMVKDVAAGHGLEILAYGVVGLPNDEAECRRVFEFAKAMGIRAIASEPPEDAMDLVDRLCQEYQIPVGIHNHPQPSHYWNPDKVLEVCKGRSRWIGACADTGHWTRSGVNPVEAVRKLQGRIIYFHLKDLNEFGKLDAHDDIWGTGVSQVGAVLAEMKKQGWNGIVSAEYEYNWDNSVPDVRQCIQWFRETTQTLGVANWELLLDENLSQWQFKPGSWDYEDSILTRKGGGDIWSRESFGDFVLELDYKLAPGANSGVFLRCGDLDDWVHTTIEVQIHDTGDGNPRGTCGSIYDILTARKAAQKPAGQWNHYRIVCVAGNIDVYLNGEQVISMDLNDWTEAGKNPDGSKNKFKYAYKDMPRRGRIGLQDHGDPIAFRNIRIKRLDQDSCPMAQSSSGGCCRMK